MEFNNPISVVGGSGSSKDHLILNSNYSVGKPSFFIQGGGGTTWTIGLWDGVTSNGSINIAVGTLSINGSNVYTTSNLTTFTSSTNGLVPASGGGTTNFLRADGTWAAVSTSADVVGPASSTDNAVVRFDGITGKLIQNSSLTVSDSGTVTATGSFVTGSSSLGNGTLAIGANAVLVREADNVIAQRNGVSTQEFRLYNNFTDAGNYERVRLYYSSTAFRLSAQKAGTGVNNRMVIDGSETYLTVGGSDSTGWRVNPSAHLFAITDNTFDIGAPGSNRPRSIYVGTSMYVGSNVVWNAGNVGTNGSTLIGYTPANKAGDTFTGDVTHSGVVNLTRAAGPILNFDTAAGTYRQIQFKTSGVNRAVIQLDSSAESGSDAGSTFAVRLYSDAGVETGNIIGTRATGVFRFSNTPQVGSNNIWHAGNTGTNGASLIGYTPANDSSVVKLTGNQTVAGIKTFTSGVRISNTSPSIEFIESDQTLPAGAWAIRNNNGNFQIQRNTAVDGGFSTATLPITIDNSDQVTFITTPKVGSDLIALAKDFVGLTGDQTIAGNKTFSGNITLANLTVTGTTTSINTTNLSVTDQIITLAQGNTTGAAPYVGIKFERGTNDAYVVWEESTDQFLFQTATSDAQGSNVAVPIQALQFKSKATTGTAPLTVDSTTKVDNLNADTVDGYHADEAATVSTLVARDSSGKITHSGLTMSSGTEVDQIYSAIVPLSLTADTWTDTDVNASDLATGSYLVQLTVGSDQVYTGVMSWYSGDTDSTSADEFALHGATASTSGAVYYMRVSRTLTADTNDLKLQILSNITISDNYTFKFRRMI